MSPGSNARQTPLRQNKADIQAKRYVQQYALRLFPHSYASRNRLRYDKARDMETEIAIDLREGGHGV